MPVNFTVFLWLFAMLIASICAFPVQSQAIDIWAEEFEPLSYKGEKDEIVGMNTELVKALVEESGIDVRSWQIAPWARAYKESVENPDSLLYTIARTANREHLFHWIGPIGKREVGLFKLKKRKDLNVRGWQDLRKLRIGSLLGSASSESLKTRDIKQYELSNLRQIVHMLVEERIDVANMLNYSLAYLAPSKGLDFSDFERVWVVDDSKDFYIALNRQTAPETVKALQLAFIAYRQDGRLMALHQKYLHNAPDAADSE